MCECPHHQLKFSGFIRSGVSIFGCELNRRKYYYFPTDNAYFKFRFSSKNNDKYDVQVGWCSSDTYEECELESTRVYNDNFEHEISFKIKNRKYKNNIPIVQVTEHNFFEDAQIVLEGAIIERY